jgi:hypothetical protein
MDIRTVVDGLDTGYSLAKNLLENEPILSHAEGLCTKIDKIGGIPLRKKTMRKQRKKVRKTI